MGLLGFVNIVAAVLSVFLIAFVAGSSFCQRNVFRRCAGWSAMEFFRPSYQTSVRFLMI